jgi:hypothetical protein
MRLAKWYAAQWDCALRTGKSVKAFKRRYTIFSFGRAADALGQLAQRKVVGKCILLSERGLAAAL